MKPLLPLYIIAITFTGCTEKPQAEKAEIERFDSLVADYHTMEPSDRATFRHKYSDAILFITKGDTLNSDSVIDAYSRSNALKMFGKDVNGRLTMTDSLETALGEIKAGFNEKLPDIKWKRIIGVISTYNQSVILTDSSLLLGLNHYLGSDYEAYSYFEPYQRAVKTPRHLPYDVAEALIVNRFPFIRGNESTLLNRILYEGSVLTAVNEVVPGNNAAESMGYDTIAWKWLSDNEKQMWNAMIDREMLFSMDPAIADRMTRPAPATSILHPDAPGRATRYIGYKIVESYRKRHPEKTLQWLLSPEFYNSPSTLIDSQYIP